MTLTLTPDQERQLEEIRQEWIAVGLRTDRLDEEKASAALKRAYEEIGRECPPILYFPSPKGCVYARAKFLWAWDQLHHTCTTEQLHAKAAECTDEQAAPYIKDWADNVLGGNTWAGWHGWTDAMRRIGVPDIERVDAINAVAREVHLWYPYEQVIFVSDFPTAVRLDDRQRLHGEGVPAIEYTDGWGLWVWHEVDANERVVTGNFTKDDFLAERNAEVRRVMAEVKGWEWVLDELGGKRLETDEYGTTWSIDLSHGTDNTWDRQEALIVDVLNSTPEPDGSIKRYLLSVDPEECRGWSPRDCIGWTFNLPRGSYSPQVMS